jgi:hypothetical protein
VITAVVELAELKLTVAEVPDGAIDAPPEIDHR